MRDLYSLSLALLTYLQVTTSQYLTSEEYWKTNGPNSVNCSEPNDGDSIYKYSLPSLDGTRDISMAEFENKVLLISNIATF